MKTQNHYSFVKVPKQQEMWLFPLISSLLKRALCRNFSRPNSQLSPHFEMPTVHLIILTSARIIFFAQATPLERRPPWNLELLEVYLSLLFFLYFFVLYFFALSERGKNVKNDAKTETFFVGRNPHVHFEILLPQFGVSRSVPTLNKRASQKLDFSKR